MKCVAALVAMCSVLLCTAVGCGPAATTSGSSAKAELSADPSQQLLDSVVASIGADHFSSLKFGHSKDPAVASPDAPWLEVGVPRPAVGAGTEDYWAAVLLEHEFNAGAKDAGADPIAGMTITASAGDGKVTTDGQTENDQGLGLPLDRGAVQAKLESGIEKLPSATLDSVSYIGVDGNVPVVRLKTNDPATFVKQVQNAYFTLFGDSPLEGGYVEVSDADDNVVLVGAAVPDEGFTAVWVPPSLDWHTLPTQQG